MSSDKKVDAEAVNNKEFLESLGQMSRAKLIDLCKAQQEQLDTHTAQADVQRGGNTIVIPEGMSLEEAGKWITRKLKDEETVIQYRHIIQCHPLEGAVAMMRAIADIYGWSQSIPTPGFFGDTPPVMINVRTGSGKDDFVQVPWGQLKVSGIDGNLQTGYSSNAEGAQFIIAGELKKKDQYKVLRIVKRTEELLKESSIYKNKALELSFEWLREGRDFDPDADGFDFVDMGALTDDQLIFDAKTARVLRTTLFSFLENASALRQNNIPLKRGVLLEGTYGVGKTLTAKLTALKAVANGWTFILVPDARDLDLAIQTARNYQPCVVFCEDIDKSVVEERTIAIDKILNTLDGIKSKDTEIVVVLTTNNVEKIAKALIRPGRIDAVVSLNPPDSEAAGRLVKLYGAKTLSTEIDFDKVGEAMAGQIPAVIREVVERSKVTAIARSGSASVDGCVTTDDLLFEAEAMQRHMKLLNDRPVQKPDDNVGTAIGKLITEHTNTAVGGMVIMSGGKPIGKLEKSATANK